MNEIAEFLGENKCEGANLLGNLENPGKETDKRVISVCVYRNQFAKFQILNNVNWRFYTKIHN